MSWIQTWTGKPFEPLNPDPETIDIADIAHALSMLCRFNGHCTRFYSVAEHSVRASVLVPPEDALWALLHDAAEAYVSDLPRPIKDELPVFRTLEDRLLRVIVGHFGLPWPMPESVRLADDIMLVTEQRDLMRPPPRPWGLNAAPLPERIVPVGPAEAEAAFLERFGKLRSCS